MKSPVDDQRHDGVRPSTRVAGRTLSHEERVGLTVLMCCRDDWQSLLFVLSELRSALANFLQVACEIEVLVVDDSVDESLNEYDLAAVFSQPELGDVAFNVIRGPNAGLSAATSRGLLEVLRCHPKHFVLMLDSDGQHDVRAGHDLLRLALATGTDCVIGSRWVRGGSAPGLTGRRRWFSKLSRIPLRLAGVPRVIRDPTTSFRCYSPRAVALLAREGAGFMGFAFFPAAVALLRAEGLQVREVPIAFRPRLAGSSSLSLRVVWRTLLETPSILGQCIMLRRRAEWFTESGGTSYVGTDELAALEAAVKFQHYVAGLAFHDCDGKWLEIGAGSGASARALLNIGSRNASSFKLDLLEPDDALRASLHRSFGAEPRVGEVFGSIDEIGSVRYRRIFLFSVLEHVEDDISFLRRISRYLESGGVIIVFVPRLPAIYGTVDGSSGHYRRYRRNEIRAVGALSGLRLTRCKGIDTAGWFPYWVNYGLRKNPTISPRVVGMADRILVPITKVLDRAPLISEVVSKNLLFELQLPAPSELDVDEGSARCDLAIPIRTDVAHGAS